MATALRTIFAILTISSYSTLFAQTGDIVGWIRDKESKEALSGASIALADGRNEHTDDLGRFRINTVPTGKYEMIITYIGYRTTIVPIEVREKEKTEVMVDLLRSNLDLREIRVNSRKQSELQTISAVDIMLRPVNTSQDVLRIVPGLFLAQHAGGGKAEQIFLRGFDIDHGTDIRLSVDGIPVNMVSHAHGQGYADLHFLIPETIEKVQFDKGPYQSDQGNQATAGFVAFKTKDFIRENLLKAEAGRFGLQRFYGQFKVLDREKGDTRQQFYLASEYARNKGYFESPQDYHRFNVLGKYHLQEGNKRQLTILASAFDSKWYASGQVPDRAVKSGLISRFGSIDDTEGGNTSRVNTSVQYQHRWNSGWISSDQIYYTRYHFNLFSNFTFFLNDPVDGDGINQRESRDLFGYNGSLVKQGQLAGKPSTTRIGYGFRADRVQDIELAKSVLRSKTDPIQRGDVRENDIFVYGEKDIRLGNRVQVKAGLRFDQMQFAYRNTLMNETNYRKQERATLNPSLRIQYTLNADLRLYGNLGTGFHSNDTRVILDNAAREILPKVYAIDAGVEFKPTRGLLVHAATWYLLSEQEFVYVGDEGIIEPGGKTQRMGIDLMARYQMNKWLFADMDLNLTRARAVGVAKEEAYVPLAAAFTSTGGISAKPEKGPTASLRYRWITSRPANEFNSIRTDGYFLLDAALSYPWKRLEFYLSAENILDVDWREAQFDTESRLKNEAVPVSEIHYTPGIPFFIKAGISVRF